MKMWKKILTSVLSAVMVLNLFAGNVCAAETTPSLKSNPYTYTVTFYAGAQGTFKDSETPDKIVIDKVAAGTTVGINAQAAITLPEDSKYYVKGIRLSGRDNDTVDASAFVVDGDADYVVAYGIKGEQVKYTVKYVHESGKKLAEEDVFYGNVGDKPVVAYKYIQGYNPKVYAFTKTLLEDESKNVFEFVYTDATEPTVKEIVTEDVAYNETVITINGGTTVVGGGAGGTGGASNVTGGGDGAVEEVDGTGTGEGAEAGNEAEMGEDLVVDLVVDLDEETPLANIDVEGNTDGSMTPMALYVGMGLLALIAIIVAVYFTKKLKKKEEA